MNYSPDEFLALVQEVERQGGAHLPDECEPVTINYKIGNRKTKVNSCHCGNESIFVTVYEPTADAEKRNAKARGGGFARTCAVCDEMGAWPRYMEEA